MERKLTAILKEKKENTRIAQAQKFDLNTVKEFARQCSNWGKWGAEDELGTINYITPEKVRQAAQLVKRRVGGRLCARWVL